MAQRETMRQIIRTQDIAAVTIITSHIAEDLEQLCDRVLVLNGGSVRFLGTPAEAVRVSDRATFADAVLHLSTSESSQ